MEKVLKQKIKFVFAKDYNPEYANGAWGGYTPQGEFVLNFFQDRQPIPRSLEHEYSEAESKFKEICRDYGENKPDVVRVVTTGVTLHYGAAKHVHKWLGDQIKEFEANVKIIEIESVAENIGGADGQSDK